MMEMVRQRLSAEVGGGCVRDVRSSMDRLGGHWAKKLHRRLMGGKDWSGSNGFHCATCGRKVVKAWG